VAGRFGRIAARADDGVALSGLSGGARRILPDLSLTPAPRGADRIPQDGPLLLISNHPGGFDSVVILSCIPRKDVKVFISDVPFSRAFLFARQHFIYTPKSVLGGQAALRSGVEHLQAGGSLLIFPHHEVEPDPELGPGAAEAIGDWSRSIEIMLRRVPQTRLQVAIASGVLMPKFLRNPLVRIRKEPARRQKLAEVIQIVRQMLLPRSVRVNIHVSFGRPAEVAALAQDGLMDEVIRMARGLLDDHMASLRTSS
jgi:hypothetical protein